jgi:hypothetical protein
VSAAAQEAEEHVGGAVDAGVAYRAGKEVEVEGRSRLRRSSKNSICFASSTSFSFLYPNPLLPINSPT